MPTEPKPKIHAAMAAILEALPAIGKTAENKALNFKFRSIDAILNELNEHFGKQGVFLLPEVLDVKVEAKAKGYAAMVTVAYTFMADDGSAVRAVSVGEGHDFGDKAVSKAMTMALKTCLGQVFAIATEDDPDGESVQPPPAPPGQGAAESRSGAAGAGTGPAAPPAEEPWMATKAKVDAFLAPGTAGHDGRREQLLAQLAERKLPTDLAQATATQLKQVEEVIGDLDEPF